MTRKERQERKPSLVHINKANEENRLPTDIDEQPNEPKILGRPRKSCLPPRTGLNFEEKKAQSGKPPIKGNKKFANSD